MNILSSLFYKHEFLFKYTLIPIIPLTFIAILSINPLLWASSEIHHFYIELFAVVFGLVLSFYYLLRARAINDIFSLFIGLGFLISAVIDLLHVIVSYYAISDPMFIKYFIPQTWFAGRIFLSSLLTIAILKYSKSTKEAEKLNQSNDEYIEQQQNPNIWIQKRFLFYLILLAIFSISAALSSLYVVFPESVIDAYSLHRPYEIPPLFLFSIALIFFYKRKLNKRNDLLYKGLAIYLILDIFSQIVMSYSAVSFDTAHNVAHVLKDAAYFVNIIALSLSSIQSNVELQKSNELIRVQNKKLKETGNMQKEFINIAAHELRTPIQPILGLSDLLIYRCDKGTENQKMAEVIHRNALKLQHLAQDILDVTKIESQSLDLNKEKFDLSDLILNSISDFENSIKKKSEDLLNPIKIIYNKPNEQNNNNFYPITVEADRVRIGQVLSNLLSNANKSIIDTEEKKTRFIYINLKRVEKRKQKVHHIDTYNQEQIESSDPKEATAVISIQDEGSGIKSELRPRLYEKFASGSMGGTGLGLFISKSIIESHEGQLWFEDNKDGKGVTFYFTLPILPDLSKKSPFMEDDEGDDVLKNSTGKDETILKKSISSINNSNPYSKDNERIRVLLVDDDADINITLKKVLEEKGYEIQTYVNPIKAVEDFKKNLYDLIILDIKMPKMNGFEFYNEIRKIDKEVKVCFLTAGEMNSDKHYEMFKKSMFLQKPIENEALLKIIENIEQ
jgi:signal transduction histidine kinase/CheY-like chemotaxis protein